MYDRPAPLGIVSLRNCRNAASLSEEMMYQICNDRKACNECCTPSSTILNKETPGEGHTCLAPASSVQSLICHNFQFTLAAPVRRRL